MKFTLDVTLPARIDTTRGEGDEMPFVRAVLAVDGVASVFGVNDFVTVMRDPDTDWNTIVCAVKRRPPLTSRTSLAIGALARLR